MSAAPPVPHGGSPSIRQPDYWWYRARSEMLRTVLGPYVGWVTAPHKVSLDLDPRGLRPPEGVCGSLLSLPFADASFEVITAFDVIEHCEPEVDALRELYRVLEPGGRLLVSVPAYQWAWSDHDVANGHHRRYTRGRAETALEQVGFEVLRSTYGFAGVFPMFVAERLVRGARHRFARRTHRPADVVEVPDVGAGLEKVLLGLCRLDERVLARRDLPFGSSVFLAAVKS